MFDVQVFFRKLRVHILWSVAVYWRTNWPASSMDSLFTSSPSCRQAPWSRKSLHDKETVFVNIFFFGGDWWGLFQNFPCPPPLKFSSLLAEQLAPASSRDHYFPPHLCSSAYPGLRKQIFLHFCVGGEVFFRVYILWSIAVYWPTNWPAQVQGKIIFLLAKYETSNTSY